MHMFIPLLAIQVFGHGSMTYPPIWMDPTGSQNLESYQSCSGSVPDVPWGYGGGACFFFTNYTFVEEATIPADSELRTYSDKMSGSYFNFDKTPWRAPGHANVHSPCGFGGGNPSGCNGGKDCPGGGYGFGLDALEMEFPDAVTTTWEAGSVVEAMWATIANHGGGYSYRLCKVPEEGKTGLTEECFNEGHLNFVGDYSWVQYGTDLTNRTAFRALRTKEGTFPKNSQWTKNPIPPCYDPYGGILETEPFVCDNGPMFPVPAPGLMGYGEHTTDFVNYVLDFPWSVVDKLQVPKNLEPGVYVLSFRWDCEQTPQVWNQCSNIKVVKPKKPSGFDPLPQALRAREKQLAKEKLLHRKD